MIIGTPPNLSHLQYYITLESRQIKTEFPNFVGQNIRLGKFKSCLQYTLQDHDQFKILIVIKGGNVD